MLVFIGRAPASTAEICAEIATTTIGSRMEPFAAIVAAPSAGGLEWHEAPDSTRDFLTSQLGPWQELGYESFAILLPGSNLATEIVREHARTLAFFLKRTAAQRAWFLCASAATATSTTAFASWLERKCSKIGGAHDAALQLAPAEPPPICLETPRLLLTFAEPAQIEGYYRAICDSNMFDTLLWDGPDNVQALHDHTLKSRQLYALGPEHALNLAIIEKSTRQLIGGVSWRPLATDPLYGTIGYTLEPKSHGRGYATEATQRLVAHVFDALEAERIEAEVFLGNDASRRVLEKCGFSQESVRRASVVKRGERLDEWVYALTRADWRRR
ncbi:MAG: GNAT family N-acetyltransferase [Planctomycetota bacterium]